MTVSSSTNRVSYSGNGSTTVFAYTFKVFDQDDLTVIIRSADGTETVKTITTDYTVSGVGNDGGGNVTFGTAPASGETVVVLREQDLVQELDLVPNDPFPAEVLESALDKLTFMVQQHEEELGRTIKASRTNTITGAEFTISAVNRANKIFAFDSAGDVSITQELGTYRGNWATATAFAQRDIVKDTSNNNIYICLTAHTSTGAQPISSNADVAKWALIVDAASATTSALAAASSASAAATSESNAATSESNAATSESNAATSEGNAATSESNAAASASSAATLYDNFDDRYLGAKATDPTLDNDGDALIDGALYFDTANNVMKVYDLGTTTWLRTTPTSGEQANIDTVSGISANVTTVAGIAANVTTVAGNSANVTTVAGISANVTTVATDIANVNTVATNINSVNNFADSYVVSATEPASPVEGMLWFDTSTDTMKVYNGSSFQNAGSSVNGTSERNVYTATSGQTSFAATYDAGFVDVYLNGVKLVDGTDFTATNGSSVVLAVGATTGDIVDIVAYGTFSLANVYTQAASDARYYTQTASDERYTRLFATSVITGNTNAAINTHYYLNGAGITLTLPSSPTAGDEVRISEVAGNTDGIIARNGSNIMSAAENLTVDSAYAVIYLRYTNATIGWTFS